MFAPDNTEGYSSSALAVLNTALVELRRSDPGVAESNLNDAILEAYDGGATTVAALVGRVRAKLRGE